MSSRTCGPLELFLDDGGVLNDNSLRGPEWLRLIGAFMPARLGGTAEQWASANRIVFSQVWGDLQKRLPDFASHEEFQRIYATTWLRSMCAYIGITPPPDDEAVTLYRELSSYIGERATSAIAGAADAFSLCSAPDTHSTPHQERRHGNCGASWRRWASRRSFRGYMDRTLLIT